MIDCMPAVNTCVPDKVLVTGATGFIGRALVKTLATAGHEVIGLSRTGNMVPGLFQAVRWSLGDPLPDGVFADLAVHLAYDFEGDVGAVRTRDGTILLADALYAAGVSRQLFVSSYSAGPHSVSRYGRTKAELENALGRDRRTIVVRPGLVVGDSGIYGRLVSVARRFPVLVLPDGGHGRVPIVTIDRLCDELVALCKTAQPPQEANLFNRDLPTLRELVLRAAAETGHKPAVLPIPVSFVLPMMRCIEALGIRPPVSSDSLRGFMANQKAHHISTIED